VPPDLVLVVWYIGLIGALVWTTTTVLRAADASLRARTLTPFVAVLFLMMYTVIQSNLRNGQVNLLVLAFCVLAFSATRENAEIRGALAWGIAIAIKTVPAILVPYFVRRGRWRFVVSGLAVVAMLCLLPMATMGTAAVTLGGSYLVSFVSQSFAAGLGADPLDFSTGGMLIKLAPRAPIFWLRVIGALAPVIVAVLSDWWTRVSVRSDLPAFALYLAIIPLASPKSEVHHLVLALPAAAITGASLWYGFAQRRGIVAWCLSISALSYVTATAVRAIADRCYFVSLCALVAATIALKTEPEPHTERPGRLHR
jgi:hypothetical protein